MQTNLTRFIQITVVCAFTVVLLGAYTRLKDAGLGCPDWPGCYGRWIAPADEKAWIEMIHRYIAGTLGLLILGLAIWRFNFLSALLVALVVFQALLGMWTVTLGLYPVIVMGHLLGGFAILSLLWLMFLKQHPVNKITVPPALTWICLTVLVVQIALGGWTSANYAAIVCADFPTCQGRLLPPMDLKNAFNLFAVGIFDSPGIPLDNAARVTIQVFHRLGALATAILIFLLSYKLIRRKFSIGYALMALLIVQVGLGITNVLAALPLAISLMHNFVAALLLLTLIYILNRQYAK